jgi:hypothetical protein
MQKPYSIRIFTLFAPPSAQAAAPTGHSPVPRAHNSPHKNVTYELCPPWSRPSASLQLFDCTLRLSAAATFPLFLVLLVDSSSRPLHETSDQIRHQALVAAVGAPRFPGRVAGGRGWLADLDRRPTAGAATGSTNAENCSYVIPKKSKELQYFIILYSISISLIIQ